MGPGGHRRRLLLQILFSKRRTGWTAGELRDSAQCGQATVYEVLRALTAIELVHPSPGRRYSVDRSHELAKPLTKLIAALEPYAAIPVSRPARGSRRT